MIKEPPDMNDSSGVPGPFVSNVQPRSLMDPLLPISCLLTPSRYLLKVQGRGLGPVSRRDVRSRDGGCGCTCFIQQHC